MYVVVCTMNNSKIKCMLTQPPTSCVRVFRGGGGGGGQSGVGEYLAYCILRNAASRWQDWFVGTYMLCSYSMVYD